MSKKILIIEDDRDLAELYLDILKRSGFSVAAAFDGREGLEKLQNGGFDLVLLDIMLPKTDGLAVLKTIKSRPDLKEIPVILLTNLDKKSIIEEGFALGAAGYMVKTDYTPDQVVGEVRKFLGE